MKELKSQNILL